MTPGVKKFTRDNPCTKKDLWQCFVGLDGFSPKVGVVVAQSLIGAHAPRYMEAKGYLVRRNEPQGDYYVLTPAGKNWLVKGIKGYLKNHPSEATSVHGLAAAEKSLVEKRVRRQQP